MESYVTIIVFVSAMLFHYSDAGTFTWLHSDDTVNFVEGETAKLNWSVRIGAGKTWISVKITRSITNVAGPGDVDLIRRKPSGVEIFLAERGADMDLEVQVNTNVLNVTFTLGNLLRETDEMYYRLTVIDDDPDSSVRSTKLNVDGPSSCTIQPNATSVNETDIISLSVNTTGNPPVNNYIWTHPNGSSPTGITDRWTFPASRHDTGTYKVSVYNGIGDRGHCTSNIIVQYPPDRITCGNKTVLEGDDITLVCTASGSPPPDMIWIRHGNIRGKGSMLLIKGVKKRDGGKYTFRADNSLGHQSFEIFMIVQSRAKSPEITNPYKQILVVDAGEYVSLVCNASGYPVPNITWNMDGVVIGVGRTFNITRAREDDSSCYTCTADNGIGHSKNASVCLKVQYSPSSITIVPSRRKMILKEGGRLRLQCQSHGNPLPTYTWKHNGLTLPDGPNGILVLNSITRRQNGTYQCEAKNRLGLIISKPTEIVVQYLDQLEVTGSSNKSYSQSNPLVLFNLSVNAYPSNASLSCNPSVPSILTAITSHDAGISGKRYLIFVAITNVLDSASLLCKVENGASVRKRTLYFYRKSIHFKQTFTGQFKIANQEWQDELKDAKSASYIDLTTKCRKILEAAYDDVVYLAAIKIKEFLCNCNSKGSIIVRFELEVVGQVNDPLLPLRDYIKAQGGHINGLQIDYNSIQESKDDSPIPTAEDNKNIVAVLGVLLALAIVLNIILMGVIIWQRRKDRKRIRNFVGKGAKTNYEEGQINDISLQETSLTATENTRPNGPEYEPIGRRGLATSNTGIPEYEAVRTRTQQAQPQSGVQTSHPMPQYESTDRQGQTGVVLNPPPVTYQTIQSRTGDYGSLSSVTRLPPKDTALSSTGSPTRTGEYQSLQHKGVSPQYQSLGDLSKC